MTETSEDQAHARLKAALEALTGRVWEHTAQRVCDIESALDALRRGCLDAEACETARHNAHKIAGSAAMFGMPDAGEAARELEIIFDDPATARTDQARAVVLVDVLRLSLTASVSAPIEKDF